MNLLELTRDFTPQALLFDIDGVLLEVRGSYLKAVELAVARSLQRQGKHSPPALPFLVERLKNVRGYNNDWDCAYALVLMGLHAQAPAEFAPLFTALEKDGQSLAALETLLVPLLPEPERYDKALIWRDFQGYYLGREKLKALYGAEADFDVDPLYLTELPYVPAPTFEKLATRYKLGVYTGRSPEEAGLACARLGFTPHALVADDGRFKKPDPGGLHELRARLGFDRALYFGDSVDDAEAVQRFGAAADLRLIAVGAMLPGAVLNLKPQELAAALNSMR